MSRFTQFLPSRRRIGVWLRAHQLVPPKSTRFRILITDLRGDDDLLTQTRHLEAGLLDQESLGILPVGKIAEIADGEIDDDTLEQCRSLIAACNGDSLVFGDVMPAAPRIRIRMVGRYEQEAGHHGPYQMDWTELPKRFGPDVEGLLLTFMVLSVSPGAQGNDDRACLINLLRPAATKLTRLLENPSAALDSEQQGIFWHGLGLAASLLGEYTGSQRWLNVAVHAHKTALLLWQKDTVVFQWAIVQNNLGHALRLLAEQQSDSNSRLSLLKESAEAFRQALRIYQAASAAATYKRQTETNLAHTEAQIQSPPIAAE
ncbi:MAG: hypothetical protein AAF543_05785 [Pseudomonadota bacterium]